MTGRQQLAEALSAALEGWTIISDARVLDTVKKPGACILWTSKRDRLIARGTEWFQDEVTLWVLTATDKPADIEDDLDACLLAVMEALEPQASFYWHSAERGTLNDQFDGYRLTVTCVFTATPDPTPDPTPEPSTPE